MSSGRGFVRNLVRSSDTFAGRAEFAASEFEALPNQSECLRAKKRAHACTPVAIGRLLGYRDRRVDDAFGQCLEILRTLLRQALALGLQI